MAVAVGGMDVAVAVGGIEVAGAVGSNVSVGLVVAVATAVGGVVLVGVAVGRLVAVGACVLVNVGVGDAVAVAVGTTAARKPPGSVPTMPIMMMPIIRTATALIAITGSERPPV